MEVILPGWFTEGFGTHDLRASQVFWSYLAQQTDVNSRDDRRRDYAGDIRPHGKGQDDGMFVYRERALLRDFGCCRYTGNTGDADERIDLAA